MGIYASFIQHPNFTKMKPITSLFLFFALYACNGPKSEIFTTQAGAIAGYDPVAYFEEGKPVMGNPAYMLEWKGSTWYFVSEENLRAFESNPTAYAPQYGGYCAYAVAMGSTAKIDPGCWKIVNGKLYLNFDPSIQAEWEANQEEFIAFADSNWPDIIN